mgnify:CR=1 FL=1
MINETRIMKMIFTLKSGKSIVVSLIEEEALKSYNEWINSIKENKQENSLVIISKKSKNRFNEIISILCTEIASIQIVKNEYGEKFES